MKQIFIENYIGKPLNHEYNLSINQLEKENKLNLFHTGDGDFAGSLIDTGNGIELISDQLNPIFITYCTAEKLLILLTENNKTKIEFREFIILKTI